MINNLIYADDTVIITESEEQLQGLINVIAPDSEEKGLILNSTKSFTMVFSKSSTVPKFKTVFKGNFLEQVELFIYLGETFTSDGRCEKRNKKENIKI